MSEARAYARAGAALAAAEVAALLYAVDRTVAALRMGPIDPFAVVATARIDYFWRAGVSAFVASLVLLVWPHLARGREARAFGWTARALWPVAVVCGFLAFGWP